ncbi:MAG: DEAD/DEAH box helicase family protein [Thermodesulfobacteriota bacterium]|nr:DEAD/DEAH box helicase family protein [Thermodesulfobacteriota bacterium]
MMIDRQLLRNQDLVLKVSPNVDPAKLDISKYEAFLDALCGDREYQKEAIRETLRYLLGGRYNSLRNLAEENYYQNLVLQDLYPSLEDFYKHLQLPDKLSCTLDLATATGKSYVIYGIARIMLAEGAVAQALVLCPSNTIETGLTEKFRSLSGDRTLKEVLPDSAVISNPRIINASQTIQGGDICVENIHATYQRTKSSIEDSLSGKGEETLVVNDEVHHMANPPARDQALKKWKEFLLDPKYNFKYIVGDSGTCYVGNDYFTDVIYRFSLRDSIEERFVKTIDYVAEDVSHTKDEKFQKIYDNHIQNKALRYRLIKPLTILITRDIAACKRLTEDLVGFLSDKEKISRDAAAAKVLIVTSANEHKGNIPKLKDVDNKNNPVEWITSVSMLSEGWDVQNVCQIVPHEERAFNSKLLIAQVLGRGLRIPPEYKGEQPVVTVFNHDKWSSSIRGLVNEVLEIEKRLYSYPISKSEDYNFELCNINYVKSKEVVETPQVKEYDFSKGFITLASQAKKVEEETTYERAVTEKRNPKKTPIEYRMYPAEEVAQDIVNKFKARDLEVGTRYSKKYPFDKVLAIIWNSLERKGEKENLVSQENKQRILQAFGVIKRKGSKSLRYKVEAEDLFLVRTEAMDKRSLGVGMLRRNASVFFDDYSLKKGDEKDRKVLEEVLEDETLPVYALQKVGNVFDFKTPVNTAFASHKPERDFIKRLAGEENARFIDAWVKSPDVGFYRIDYSWRKGEHQEHQSFNPDFFIKVGDDILVIEIKDDGDISPENKGKLRYAREHFGRVNSLQSRQRYYFKFLSSKSYDVFFQKLRDGEYREFTSELEADLG